MLVQARVGGKELQEGVYQITHFGSSLFLKDQGFIQYPRFQSEDFFCYGVCDDMQNLLEVASELLSSDRKFLIALTEIVAKDEDPEGGWRWHKWGDYIGKQIPTTEYIYDEPLISRVYVYQIYEKTS